MLGFSQLTGGAVWVVLVLLRWFQSQFAHPLAEWWLETVVGNWEESIKSVIREVFGNVTRLVNGIFAWVLWLALLVSSFFTRDHPNSAYNLLRATLQQKSQAWQSWWQEDKASTFNAIIARDRPASASGASVQQPPAQPAAASTGQRQPRGGRRNGAARRSSFGAPPKHNGWKPLLQPLDSIFASLSSVPGLGWLRPDSRPAAVLGMRRSGSDLFDTRSGTGVAGWAAAGSKRRGFREDFQLLCEQAVTSFFDGMRWLVRGVLMMPAQELPPLIQPVLQRRSGEYRAGAPSQQAYRTLRRSNSFSSYEALHRVWTASDVIRLAGYPLEEHIVTTSDGYIMQMERIPRKNARDTVYFLHGMLDTSMGWVSNGVTGSQAFAAYDQGFDVWLGNSRANPPPMHIDPQKQGAYYWHYTVNELGMEDVAAQVDYIHIIKCTELNAERIASGELHRNSSERLGPTFSTTSFTRPQEPPRGMRRSSSDTALDGSHYVSSAAMTPSAGSGPPPPNEAQIRARHSAHRKGRPAPDALHRTSPLPSPPPANGKANGSGKAARRVRILQPPLSARTAKQEAAGGDHRPLGRGSLDVAAAPPQPAPALSSHPLLDSSNPSDSAYSSPTGSMASSPTSATTLSTFSATIDQASSLSSEEDRGAGFHADTRPPNESPPVTPGSEVRRQAMRLKLDRLGDSIAPDRVSAHGVEVAAEPTSAGGGEHQRGSFSRQQAPGRAGSGGGGADLVGVGREPYRLRAVGHSLGGASLLIYTVMCLKLRRPHHLYRLVLLTPAGFLKYAPRVLRVPMLVLPSLMRLLEWVRPGMGCAAYVPSSLLRYITFKITEDLEAIPALNELTFAGLRVLLNGDKSQWDRALRMPHYNARAMPCFALHCAMHLIQWARSGRFTLYDYGSPARNWEHYSKPEPIDIAANYGLLNIPVDVCAGRNDGVIAKENVEMHFQAMKAAGVQMVTYKEFDFGHLDFTFAVKPDLRHYVLSRLLVRH